MDSLPHLFSEVEAVGRDLPAAPACGRLKPVREVWHQVLYLGSPVAAFRSRALADRHASIFYPTRPTEIRTMVWCYFPGGDHVDDGT
jgi:hypothetical protein